MAFVQTTSPKMSGIDVANLVASLKPVDDAMVAFADGGGVFVREAGSLDLDWTAIAAGARPASDQPFTGGRTFRFNDALQAESPIYFRVRYGHGATNTPAMFIQVGTAKNADGTLAGNVCTLKVLSISVADNNPYPVWISAGPNFVTFAVLGRTANGTTAVFIIERMRDESGAETDEGAILLSTGSVGYKGRVQPIPTSPYVPVPPEAIAETHILPIGGMSGSASSATKLAMVPIAVPHNGKWRYMKALAYRWADVAQSTLFDLNHLGGINQYVALGNLAGNQWALPNSTTGIAARWE